MQLPDQAIQEFRQLYKQEYGQTLSDQQARENAQAILNLLVILTKENETQPRPDNTK